MNKWISVILTTAVITLSGCVGTPQQNLELAPGVLSSQSGRLGVVMTTMPKVDTFFPGADCLLCMATASLANTTLTSYTQTLPTDDLIKLKQEVTDLLQKKGIKVTVIEESLNLEPLPKWNIEAPNVARKDFVSLKQKYGVDKLLVMQVNSLGIRRNYASYFPTGEPTAYLNGAGYIVNLNNNAYEWYSIVNNVKGSDGKWDEPPSFPGLTNAYFQAVESSRDDFLKPFKN